jgi:hypothetical protein
MKPRQSGRKQETKEETMIPYGTTGQPLIDLSDEFVRLGRSCKNLMKKVRRSNARRMKKQN